MSNDKLRIFVSWSEERGKIAAESISSWLSRLFQTAQVFYSPEGIGAGEIWFDTLMDNLNTNSIGVIVLTPESKDSCWIHFECGALAKSLGSRSKIRICPVLFNLEEEDIRPPLSQYNMIRPDRDGFLKLAKCINDCSPNPIDEPAFNDTFDVWWEKISEIEQKVGDHQVKSGRDRSTRDMFSEILGLLRAIAAKDKHPTSFAGTKDSPAGRFFSQSYYPPSYFGQYYGPTVGSGILTEGDGGDAPSQEKVAAVYDHLMKGLLPSMGELQEKVEGMVNEYINDAMSDASKKKGAGQSEEESGQAGEKPNN